VGDSTSPSAAPCVPRQQSAVRRAGARVQATVTATTQVLVIGDQPAGISSKESKARSLGTRIVTESEWDSAVVRGQQQREEANNKSCQHHALRTRTGVRLGGSQRRAGIRRRRRRRQCTSRQASARRCCDGRRWRL
jgi:BRCT domain type II-containing protein